MLGADVLTEMLMGYGVEQVFGVPGDTNVLLYQAIARRTGEIEHVMARDERSAGFMADAYARLSNRVGIVEAPSGAGAMYALPPVAESNASSVATILFTIDVPLPGEGRGVITELDCVGLFAPITKASIQVKTPDKIPEIVRRAFRLATTGRPGAVHVVIPEDLLGQEIDLSRVSLHIEESCGRFPAHASVPASSELDRLIAAIDASSRPLIVAGGGVNRSGGARALIDFVEAMRVPVVTTITGQGAIPDTHELSIGVVGDNGFHPHANRALQDADLIVYVGSKIGSVVTVGWTMPSRENGQTIVQIDIDPGVLANNFETSVCVAGDARHTLEALVLRVRNDGPRFDDWVDRLNGYRLQFWNASKKFLADRSTPLRPEAVVAALSRFIDRPVNVVSDAGTPTPYATRYLKFADSGSRLTIPRAYGGLGYAIPAVVGAWYADAEKRPIGLFGDGSLGMNAGELETLVRLGVPAILLHFNNSCFGWIKGLHRLSGRGRNDCLSVDFSPADGKNIAEAFGLRAWRAMTADDLEMALDEAFHESRPCFIDIVVQSLGDRVPPVVSWMRKRGSDPFELAPRELTYD